MTEVFRRTTFDENKCYEFALYTMKEGKWPNEKYYTTNPLQYVGRHINTERVGIDEDGTEIFDDNGNINRVELDYEGKTCFREVDCRDSPEPKGGKLIRRKSNRRKSNRRKSNRSR